jgi:hypothetical protein
MPIYLVKYCEKRISHGNLGSLEYHSCGVGDEGIPVPPSVPMKEEVKPNFRTPPS